MNYANTTSHHVHLGLVAVPTFYFEGENQCRSLNNFKMFDGYARIDTFYESYYSHLGSRVSFVSFICQTNFEIAQNAALFCRVPVGPFSLETRHRVKLSLSMKINDPSKFRTIPTPMFQIAGQDVLTTWGV